VTKQRKQNKQNKSKEKAALCGFGSYK